MSEEIIKVVDALAAKFGIAINWAEANVMPHMQQLTDRYIGYEIANNIYLIVVWTLVSIASWAFFSVCYRKSSWKTRGFNEDDWWSWGTLLFVFVGTAVTFVSVITFLVCAKEIITCVMLPEMVILNYLKRMM